LDESILFGEEQEVKVEVKIEIKIKPGKMRKVYFNGEVRERCDTFFTEDFWICRMSF